MDLTKANQPRFQATDSDGKSMWQVYARILPAGLIGHYERQLVTAINLQDFEKVAPYLLPGSALYKAQQKLVTSLARKSITEEYVHHYLGTLITQSPSLESKIEVYEHLRIRTPGTPAREGNYHWIYTVTPKDGRLYLSAIEKANLGRYITHDSSKAEFFYADSLLQAYCNALIALMNGKPWPDWVAVNLTPKAKDMHDKLVGALQGHMKQGRVFNLTRDEVMDQDEDFEQMQGYRTKRMVISYRDSAQPPITLELQLTVALNEYRVIHDGLPGGSARINGISNVRLR